MATRRVGIVTINDDTNYGNRLQNYALQEAVRALGWEPETLRNRPPAWDRALLAPRLLHEARHDAPALAARTLTRVGERLGRTSAGPAAFLERRRAAIAAFARANVASSPNEYSERPAAEWADRYAHAIAGSDQVWNPVYRRAQGIDFLDFVPAERRIAYAPSFGVQRIPGFLRSRYRDWLAGIPHLSVRETGGRRIVAELTGRDVPVVLDPTLLVEQDVWDRLIAGRPPIVDRPYAVRFFLGHPTPEQEAWLDHDARSAGLAVVDLHALDREEYADVDPAGFVWAIAGAERVSTDSFHAAIFALRFRRPIIARTRFARDPRWDELLSQNELTAAPSGVPGLRSISDVDWDAVSARHARLRRESTEFLARGLASRLEP
ncbi:polysaccharide pyruvyl transferase family protein [Agromyces aurantiacus]|uniref:Polysaccharide pyruvyl transferase family protein n=1 Tax=Agromyces aurantiacus TaxID=165814 RepID=A0ABV9R3P2_9MICO|nr:polysaccharide pyruvyl transferase family protein [Agromyces aurantiacus]MBM7502744.1 hypothetical protein [Agromyces aurantiacus]